MTSGLLSFGYQSLTADLLVSHLHEAGAKVLADVRLTPMSRTRGLTKRAFAERLAAVGIEYRHYPTLGNPKDNRAGLNRQAPAATARYQMLLDGPAAREALDALLDLSADSSVAVLCFESEEDHCHRRLVIEALVARGARRLEVIPGICD